MITKKLFPLLSFLFLFTWMLSAQEAKPKPAPKPPEAKQEEIFQVVEEMPRFPGCENVEDHQGRKDCAQRKLLEYVQKELKYPEIAKENGVEGMVVASFIVMEDGTLSDIKVLRDIGAECGKEVKRVIEKMNIEKLNWIPGKQRGKAVRVRFNLPVKFKLPKEEILEEETEVDQSIENKKEVKNEDKKESVFQVVERMPVFPGCEDIIGRKEQKDCMDEKLKAYVKKELKYPEIAKENGVEGTVVVTFKIMDDGTFSDIKVLRDIGAGCGKEALRIIKKMNVEELNWIPGIERGKSPDVQFNFPIKFKLPKKEILEEETEVDQSIENKKEVEKKTEKKGTYKVVDRMPRFPGCEDVKEEKKRHSCADKKMLEYVYSSINYPPEARKNKIEGTVVISFMVKKDGTLGSINILRDIGSGCGAEAKRVVESMNTNGLVWLPGASNGQAVGVQFNLPVKFKL